MNEGGTIASGGMESRRSGWEERERLLKGNQGSPDGVASSHLHFAICNLQFAIRNLQFTFGTLTSAAPIPRSETSGCLPALRANPERQSDLRLSPPFALLVLSPKSPRRWRQ